jgi:sigma-B regulation protein RsbU (phosphoserine phosphatase)
MPNKIEMSRFKLFWLKNGMLAVSIMVYIGVVTMVSWLNYYSFLFLLSKNLVNTNLNFDLIAESAALVVAFLVILAYEKPIRRFIDLRRQGLPVDPQLEITAKRRLLNEPMFIVKLFLCFWLLNAAIYLVFMLGQGMDPIQIRLNLADGLVITAIALIVVVSVLSSQTQRFHAPFFFPEGGLQSVPGVKIMSLRRRVFFFVAALNLLPLMSIIRTQYRVVNTDLPVEVKFDLLSKSIYFIGPVSMAIGILLTLVVAGNLNKSIKNLVFVLQEVTRGRFNSRVRVTTATEVGYVGDVINTMTEGLKKGDDMRRALDLAREVQQNLIPRQSPLVPGLEMAGKSIYCDQTGGDYIDYLDVEGRGFGRVTVAVGDVSGHGVQSALLMATARAFLRQRSCVPGGLADIVTDVNHQLVRDVEESGLFMTLFLAEVDRFGLTVDWVSAGHDPALLYDSKTDGFVELGGRNPALGLAADFEYRESRQGLAPGQIILIGTDGIWEAHDSEGAMFGKEHLRTIVRTGQHLSAQEILETVLQQVELFMYPQPAQDDITLLVIKITA